VLVRVIKTSDETEDCMPLTLCCFRYHAALSSKMMGGICLAELDVAHDLLFTRDVMDAKIERKSDDSDIPLTPCSMESGQF